MRGGAVRGQGPPQVAPRRRRADARAGARRGLRRRDGQLDQLQHGVDLDLRAAAHVRVPRPAGHASRCGAPATRRTTTSSAPTPRASSLRVGSAVRNWKPGDRVVVHCNYVDDQDPSAHDDSMLAANQRIWGFESNFGGLADLSVVKANQLMPKPAHLTWEEAAVNGLCASTAYRMLVGRQRGPDEAGRHRVHLGRHRRHRRLRHPARAQRRRHPGRGRVARRTRPSCCGRMGCEHVDRPHGRGLPVLEGRAHPGRGRVAAPGQEGPVAGRRGPRHRLRAPRPPDDGRLGVRRQAGRHDRHLRRHQRAT